MPKETITVTVEYVGQEPYNSEEPSGKNLQAIKVAAMKSFGLDAGAADKYVLKFNGAVVENKHIGDFGMDKVTLTLSLGQEVPKG